MLCSPFTETEIATLYIIWHSHGFCNQLLVDVLHRKGSHYSMPGTHGYEKFNVDLLKRVGDETPHDIPVTNTSPPPY